MHAEPVSMDDSCKTALPSRVTAVFHSVVADGGGCPSDPLAITISPPWETSGPSGRWIVLTVLPAIDFSVF